MHFVYTSKLVLSHATHGSFSQACLQHTLLMLRKIVELHGTLKGEKCSNFLPAWTPGTPSKSCSHPMQPVCATSAKSRGRPCEKALHGALHALTDCTYRCRCVATHPKDPKQFKLSETCLEDIIRLQLLLVQALIGRKNDRVCLRLEITLPIINGGLHNDGWLGFDCHTS
jgi:hypothetical protein